MKRFRWQLIIIFLTGLVVGVLLLSEQPQGTTGTVVAPEPVKGGNYTEAVIGSLQRLNPLLDYYNPADRDVVRLLFSQLIRFDERGNPQPELATVWGISQDGTVYNLELNPDAIWHDGRPVTAQDVVFTVDMLRSENTVVPKDLQDFWNEVEVQALGDHAVQFRLPEPFAPFLDYLTFGVLPIHLLGDQTFDQMINAGFNLAPVGSGPYQFGGMIVENGQIAGIELNLFEDYFGPKPFIEQIIFRYYPDGSAALQAYREGIVQGINPVGPDVLPQVLAEPNMAVYTGRLPQSTWVLFNLKNEETNFMQDAAVRRALLTGLNRRYIIDRVFNGQAIQADGPIFPGTWAYYDGIELVVFDPDAAANQLKEAGWVATEGGSGVRAKDGIEMSFTLLYPDTTQHKAVAESIQSDWADLGVSVELQAVSYDDLIDNYLGSRNYEAALVDLNLSRLPDPDPYPFWDQVQATGGQNYSQWNNQMVSEYLEQARTTTDINERLRLYRNFQVVFADELPALPLYYPVYTYAVDQGVGGVRMGPLFDTSDRLATVLEWFLVSRPAAAAPQEATAAP